MMKTRKMIMITNREFRLNNNKMLSPCKFNKTSTSQSQQNKNELSSN